MVVPCRRGGFYTSCGAALRAMGWQWTPTAEGARFLFQAAKKKAHKEKAAPQAAAPGRPVLRGTSHVLWVAGGLAAQVPRGLLSGWSVLKVKKERQAKWALHFAFCRKKFTL